MYTFGQLAVGDLFNTKMARCVKVSSSEAIVVLSGCVPLGDKVPISQGMNVVLLWSSLLSDDPACSDRKSEQPSLSESEKEDRFYREIEDKLEAEQRADQAAAFKQNLFAERDALQARRAGLIRYLESGVLSDAERKLLNHQHGAMGDYHWAVNQRLCLLEQPAT